MNIVHDVLIENLSDKIKKLKLNMEINTNIIKANILIFQHEDNKCEVIQIVWHTLASTNIISNITNRLSQFMHNKIVSFPIDKNVMHSILFESIEPNDIPCNLCQLSISSHPSHPDHSDDDTVVEDYMAVEDEVY